MARAISLIERQERSEIAVLASRLDLDPARLRALLATDARLHVERDVVSIGGAPSLPPDAQRFLDALVAAPFAPPSPADVGVGADAVRALVKEGAVVSLDGVYFAAEAIEAARQRVANRADGAYAALSFDVACPRNAEKVKLDYRAFFAVDPSHRCIVVLRSGGKTGTALLSPQNASIDLDL